MLPPPLAFDPPPPVILVASDLHLGEGRDPDRGMYSAKENFLAGDAFRRWLAAHGADAAAGALLVLNGDSLDFLRVVRCPETPDDAAAWAGRLPDALRHLADASKVSGHERRFGLKSHAHNAVWKLHVMLTGHPGVFDGLAAWVAAGGRMVLVKGNHDLELHWDLVVDALRAELERRGARQAAERVRVAEQGFRLANLVVEHGHRHEPMTAVVGPATWGRNAAQLTYPLGSFVNRYFINRLERLDPFLDNVKPATQALLALLRRRPLQVWRTYWRGWPFLKRALRVRKRWASYGPLLLISAALVAPPVVLVLIALAYLRPELVAWIPSGVRLPGSALGLSLPALLPYAIGAVRDLGRQVGWFKPVRHLLDGAERLARDARAAGDASERLYVVMGHTHVQEVERLAAGAGPDMYVNTGTWIAVWPLDRRDLAGRVFYSYARFTLGARGEYRHASLVWDDEAGEPRAATLLAADHD